jgi:hypothetical protein
VTFPELILGLLFLFERFILFLLTLLVRTLSVVELKSLKFSYIFFYALASIAFELFPCPKLVLDNLGD